MFNSSSICGSIEPTISSGVTGCESVLVMESVLAESFSVGVTGSTTSMSLLSVRGEVLTGLGSSRLDSNVSLIWKPFFVVIVLLNLSRLSCLARNALL